MKRRNRSARDTSGIEKSNVIALAHRPSVTDKWRDRIKSAWAKSGRDG